ncbi:MAG: DUF5684 domain-containing protein [Pseudomonadota bacterium]
MPIRAVEHHFVMDTSQFAWFAGYFGFVLLLIFSVAILTVLGLVRIHRKAGYPGWTAIVPIYHFWIEIGIARLPYWWIFLFLFPLTSFVAIVMVNIHMARNFGKDLGFGIGLTLLPVVFIPILGFGSATFQAKTPSTLP